MASRKYGAHLLSTHSTFNDVPMKKNRTMLRWVGCASVLALALAMTGCTTTELKSTTRICEERKYIQLHHVAGTSETLNLWKGDAVAMACRKCKTVLYADPDRPRTKFFTPFEHRQYCPGGKSTITVSGSGFNRREQFTHTCAGCGDGSACCCATQKVASPTEGMAPDQLEPNQRRSEGLAGAPAYKG